MKKIFIKWVTFLFAAATLIGCAKDERLLFEDETRVYFNVLEDGTNVSGPGVNDSLDYSFALLPSEVVRDTFFLKCRITGQAVNHDRRINIVAEDGSDATAGYHYELLNPIIRAGQYADSIPVVLHRRPGLQDSVVTVVFRIVDSEELLAGYNDFGTSWPVSRAKYTRQQFKLTITDRLTKPVNWDTSWLPVFGEFSAVKIRFISNVTGFTNWGGSVFPQDRTFIIQTAYYALYQYELANGDLIDENGNPVKFN